MAYSYLAIYILGYLAVYLYLYFTAVLRSFGNSMFQAVAMLVSTILNAILDPIFIHFIGFHGAAIATLLSQVICLLFMLTYLKKKNLFAFKISAFDKVMYCHSFKRQFPLLFSKAFRPSARLLLTALVSTYSVTAIAAYGVTGKLETILFYPAMALNMVLNYHYRDSVLAEHVMTGQRLFEVCIGVRLWSACNSFLFWWSGFQTAFRPIR